MLVMIEIDALRPEDRAAWEVLARGYQAFYREPLPDQAYEATWQRLARAPRSTASAPGWTAAWSALAHYFFHPTCWSGQACYLQDLFVAEAARGRGAARALIEQLAAAAAERGATRLYWHTQQDNATARLLYDKVARFNGFISYERPL